MDSAMLLEDRLSEALKLVQAGHLREAEAALQTLLSKDPDHPDLLHLKGVVMLETGRWQKAVESFQHSIEKRPNNARTHYHYGIALIRKEDIGGAVEAFKAAVALDGSFHDARFNLAKALKDLGRYEAAAAVYQELIHQVPLHVEAMYNLANLYYELGQLTEAESALVKLLENCPHHLDARTNLALIKSRRGNPKSAIEMLKNVIDIDPTHSHAKQLLSRLYRKKIPAWHFDMLNDDRRNLAYDQAIRKAAKGAEHVLEIGTGSGLLSMMAARAGAKKITTCEISEVLVEIARKVIRRNGFADRVTVIPKKSTQLKIGQDLTRRADLLIAEVFDNGLLGEHFLPALQHAKQNLLQDDAVIIPAAATVYAMLLECPQLRRINPIRTVMGFDLSDFDILRSSSYRQVHLQHIDHQLLSDPIEVCRIDFQKEVPTSMQKDIKVKVGRNGLCHGVLFWFELHFDSETTLSTLNDSPSNHWKQALQFFDDNFMIKKGDEVTLGVLLKTTGLEFMLKLTE